MLSDSSTAFRLPKGLLATIDAICEKQDLTRSQLFRRSVTQYLKSQSTAIIAEEPMAHPDPVVFE
jgi:metal-responsive CopG/Arc/MetJ family transcriptional regulator